MTVYHSVQRHDEDGSPGRLLKTDRGKQRVRAEEPRVQDEGNA
jgi:hypothetical protein